MAKLVEKTYSNALFEVSLEEQSLDQTYEEMEAIREVFTKNEEFIKFLTLPTIGFEEKERVMNILSSKVSKTVYNLMLVLTQKNRIGLIIRIADEFKKQYNEYKGILEVRAIVAEKMREELKEKLVKKLESLSGKKITLVEEVDAEIKGGIVLKYDNSMIDASIKTKMDDMRNHIKSIIA